MLFYMKTNGTYALQKSDRTSLIKVKIIIEPMNLWEITVHRLPFLEKNSKGIEKNVCLKSMRKCIGKE